MTHRNPRPRRTALRLASLGAAAALAACGGAKAGNADAAPSDQTATAGASAAPAAQVANVGHGTLVTVYKSPTCGCCKGWVEHLRQAGFQVEVHDTADVQPVKEAMHLPAQLASCHTARVGGYTVEGHVPADVIAQLLREHPAVDGVAVPGMPMGSPGMEGGAPEHYDVVAFTKDGGTRVYASR
jgi:hypothetical protein